MFGCAAGTAKPLAVEGLDATSLRVRGLQLGEPFLAAEPLRESFAKFGVEVFDLGGDGGR